MIKTIGLAICAAAVVLAGFISGERRRKESKELCFVRDLADHLFREISYSKTEIPACFSSMQDDKHEEILSLLAKGNYSEAVRSLKLPKKHASQLRTLLLYLGKSGYEEELERLSKYRDYAKRAAEESSASLNGRIRADRVLGICAASALLLLLL